MRKSLMGACAFVFALGGSCALAQTGAPFFKGRTVYVYIGFGSGGSYDFAGHVVARYLGRHIPGNPTIVAENMPGSGSYKLANWLTSVAPKDGTALGIVSETIAVDEALGSQGVQYKATQFNWIGRVTSVLEIIMAWHTSQVKTIGDAREREVLTGGTGPGSPSEGYPLLLNAAAGTKFRIITGYPGSTETLLAMEKGELDAAYTSWSSISYGHQDWLAQKSVNFLVQATVARSPQLPDVPAAGELGNTPEDRAMLQLYASTAEIGRSLLAPPGLPAERVVMLRAAFDDTVKDPEFLADVKKAKEEFFPLAGADLQKLIETTAQAPPAVIARMKQIVQAAAK